jgi:hypothetical protein
MYIVTLKRVTTYLTHRQVNMTKLSAVLRKRAKDRIDKNIAATGGIDDETRDDAIGIGL